MTKANETATMNTDNPVLVVIGQIGAGKTEVCRSLAGSLGARHLAIEDVRRSQTGERGPTGIAKCVASFAAKSLVLFECTGASRDFEEILENIRLRGCHTFVVLLDCGVPTALRRVRQRSPSPPRSGGSWDEQIRWTESRLRLVPADLTLSSETASPTSLASAIDGEWETMRRHSDERGIVFGEVSFSQLAAFQVCALSYRLKYVDLVSEAAASESMVLGGCLHDVLAWLYGSSDDGPELTEVLAGFKDRLADALCGKEDRDASERLFEAGKRFLTFHYEVVYEKEKRRTIAVEKDVRMELGEGLTFVGRVDRVALDASGVVEVIDCKSSTGAMTSRPRIPDSLQLAAYSASILNELNLRSVIARRVMLATGEEDRFAFAAEDVDQTILALRRWARRSHSSGVYPANVGAHCPSCQFNPVCPERGAVAYDRASSGRAGVRISLLSDPPSLDVDDANPHWCL